VVGQPALLADAGPCSPTRPGLGLALRHLDRHAPAHAGKDPTVYYRAEILAALVNAIVLLGVAGLILVETYRRVLAPPEILGGPMLAVATVGLVVNLACAWILHGAAAASLTSEQRTWRCSATRSAPSVWWWPRRSLVATGWTLADPLVSGAIALGHRAAYLALLRQAVNVSSRDAAHLDLGDRDAMRRVPGVRRVHDLHRVDAHVGREAMSAHVVVDDVRDSEAAARDAPRRHARALRHRPHDDPARDGAPRGAPPSRDPTRIVGPSGLTA